MDIIDATINNKPAYMVIWKDAAGRYSTYMAFSRREAEKVFNILAEIYYEKALD